MKTRTEVGLWIDHRQAVIAFLRDREEEISHIRSDISKHVRFSDASHAQPSTDMPDVWAEDTRDRRFAASLDQYYDKVAACLSEAESILIFGPGEAKIELEKHLKRNELGNRTIEIEAADKMTDAQITAKVRRYFRE